MLLVFNNPISRAMLTRGSGVPLLRLNQDLVEFIESCVRVFVHFVQFDRVNGMLYD